MKNFSKTIVSWYDKNKRDLPWRNTSDPYLIWLSEIILQQTRVDQGMSYYLKFASEFPTVAELAAADNDRIMKLWQGLGYYSRARNLHAAAKAVVSDFSGNFPDRYEEILSLKGIGDYTAAAIASFAFNKPHAVVDGNVYRVLSRIFGIETPIDSSQGKREFSNLANELIDKKNPGMHNQAIMEFGALQCKPVNPDCSVCPFNNDCFAFSKNIVNVLPFKEKKTKVRDRYFNYIIFNYKGTTVLNKRTAKDIWINLHDFPLIETAKEVTETQLLASAEWKKLVGGENVTIRSVSPLYKHILSHQRIFAKFIELDCKRSFYKSLSDDVLIVKDAEISGYAVPRLIETYLEARNK